MASEVTESSANPRHTPRHGTSTGDVVSNQTPNLPERVYQTLLGTDQQLRRAPKKYNIGEIALEPALRIDTEWNDMSLDMQTLADAEKRDDVRVGRPYIAQGIMEVTDESEAVLRTASGLIHLGKIGAHAQRMFLLELKGYEMVLPVMIDAMDDTGMRGRPGEKAAYLIPNPDLLTRQRLKRIEGRADFKGEVLSVDQEDQGTVTIQTKPGRNWFWRKRREIPFDTGRPRYDHGRGNGEPVQPQDRVKVSVEFIDGAMMLVGNPLLLDFSPEHARDYAKQRQTTEQGFKLFEKLLTNDEIGSITSPNGKPLDVSEPHIRGAVTRYLFAELRKRQLSFTPDQHVRLWDLVASMPAEEKPVMFNNFDAGSKPDPRREQLDKYFSEQDQDAKLPKLVESMTPSQLLYEMTTIAATSDSPFSLDVMMGILRDYSGQFPEGASSLLLQNVLVFREEQLRTGENALPAMVVLLDALPYLKEKDSADQADWLAHLIQAGGLLAEGNLDAWKDSPDLSYFIKRCLEQLESAVYKDKNYFGVNYEALFALAPYYVDHLKYWPEQLPYELGNDPVVAHLLRDLRLIDAGVVREDIEQLERVTTRLQNL